MNQYGDEATGWMAEARFPVGAGIFCHSHNDQIGSGTYPATEYQVAFLVR
jgi:hypothetical protein